MIHYSQYKRDEITETTTLEKNNVISNANDWIRHTRFKLS